MSTFDADALSRIFDSSSTYSSDYSWAAIAGTIILGFGQEARIHDLAVELFSDLDTKGHTVQITAFRQLREALLKASPLVGFPRSINGLSTLRETIEQLAPEVAKELETDKSKREAVSLDARRTRGLEFFRKIYAQHTERVLTSMNKSSGGDLGEFALTAIYGDLVAETSILGAKETGLLEFVACVTLGAGPQAKGYVKTCRFRCPSLMLELLATCLGLATSVILVERSRARSKWLRRLRVSYLYPGVAKI